VVKGRLGEKEEKRVAVITEDPRFYQRVSRALSKIAKRIPILLFPVKPSMSLKGFKYAIVPEDRGVKGIPMESVLIVKEVDTEEEISINFLRLLMSRREYGEVSIGIDPGGRIGVCIMGDSKKLWGGVVYSPEELIDLLKPLKSIVRSRLYVVRIGNGAPLCRDEIINVLVDRFRIEVVDEEKLPKSESDAESAHLIAITPGYRVREKMEHRVSKGEIAKIQEKSRITTGRVTISKELAEKVAKREISLKRAIELMGNEEN